MSRPRAKSNDRSGVLLPPVPSDSRERVEALRKVYGRPTTAHRYSRPPTAAVQPEQMLPEFLASRVSAYSRVTSAAVKRSQSETRGSNRNISGYGRSPSRERLDDMRQELIQAKRHNAQLHIENKKLHTYVYKLKRESDRREQHLQSLVSRKFQPAEVNDTQMAQTFAAIKQGELDREHVIHLQAQELETLRMQLARATNGVFDGSGPSREGRKPSIAESDERDTNSSVETREENGRRSSSISKSRIHFEDDKANNIQDTFNKNKRRVQLAKAYADQNVKLKERLKQLKENYLAVQDKNKKREAEIAQNATTIENKGRNVYADMEAALEKMKADRDSLAMSSKDEIRDLSSQLQMAYSEIDALKMKNEHLLDVIRDFEQRSTALVEIEQAPTPIEIPKLDMTQIDSIGTGAGTANHNEESPIIEDKDSLKDDFEIEPQVLAMVLAEIAGAHVKRTAAERKKRKPQSTS